MVGAMVVGARTMVWTTMDSASTDNLGCYRYKQINIPRQLQALFGFNRDLGTRVLSPPR